MSFIKLFFLCLTSTIDGATLERERKKNNKPNNIYKGQILER